MDNAFPLPHLHTHKHMHTPTHVHMHIHARAHMHTYSQPGFSKALQGYLTLLQDGPSLMLKWIPNSLLRDSTNAADRYTRCNESTIKLLPLSQQQETNPSLNSTRKEFLFRHHGRKPIPL